MAPCRSCNELLKKSSHARAETNPGGHRPTGRLPTGRGALLARSTGARLGLLICEYDAHLVESASGEAHGLRRARTALMDDRLRGLREIAKTLTATMSKRLKWNGSGRRMPAMSLHLKAWA